MTIMFKLLVIIGSLILLCQAELTEEQKNLLKLYHDECLEESGVDEDTAEKARQGELIDDPKLKEHLFCISKKLAFQDDSGEIQEEVLKAKVNAVIGDEDKTEALVEKCAIKKETPQETAYETFKCYFEETKSS